MHCLSMGECIVYCNMHASCNCFLRKEISSICIATKNIATEAVIDVYENIAFMHAILIQFRGSDPVSGLEFAPNI